MSEPKLISPMLDNFGMGAPISDHNGVRCCPAMEQGTEDKYIVKVISIPASQTQLDALLLTGAYANAEGAKAYFRSLSEDVVEEAAILQKLAKLEGFVPYDRWQIVEMEDSTGYDVYLLGSYKRSLERHLRRNAMTQLAAVNLGLDLCAALATCRRSGYLYVDLKPENVFITEDQEYRIGDLGFIRLGSLQYASLPDKYRSCYTPPEITDAFSALNTTLDTYALGLMLYQAYNDGKVGVVVDAHHIFIIVIVAALAEGLGDGELVADAHIHQAIHGIAVQEFHHGLFQNVKIGHGLIQGVTGVKDLPCYHIGKMGNPLCLLKISSITEQLYPLCLKLLCIHSTSLLYEHVHYKDTIISIWCQFPQENFVWMHRPGEPFLCFLSMELP